MHSFCKLGHFFMALAAQHNRTYNMYVTRPSRYILALLAVVLSLGA